MSDFKLSELIFQQWLKTHLRGVTIWDSKSQGQYIKAKHGPIGQDKLRGVPQ